MARLFRRDGIGRQIRILTGCGFCGVEFAFEPGLFLDRSGELISVLDVPQPKASRHLAYLRRVGLVSSRKEGYWSYYRLAEPLHLPKGTLITCEARVVHPGNRIATSEGYLRDAEGRLLAHGTETCMIMPVRAA